MCHLYVSEKYVKANEERKKKKEEKRNIAVVMKINCVVCIWEENMYMYSMSSSYTLAKGIYLLRQNIENQYESNSNGI